MPYTTSGREDEIKEASKIGNIEIGSKLGLMVMAPK